MRPPNREVPCAAGVYTLNKPRQRVNVDLTTFRTTSTIIRMYSPGSMNLSQLFSPPGGEESTPPPPPTRISQEQNRNWDDKLYKTLPGKRENKLPQPMRAIKPIAGSALSARQRQRRINGTRKGNRSRVALRCQASLGLFAADPFPPPGTADRDRNL